MKISQLKSICAILLFLLLFLNIGCQNKTEKSDLAKFNSQIQVQNQNKEIVLEVFSAIDNRDFDKLKELFSDDFALNAPRVTQPWTQDDIFQGIRTFYASFPDWTHNIEEMVAEGDKVVVKLKGQGIFKAQYGEIPASSEIVTKSAMHLITVANGKVKEWWSLEDTQGFNQQLGMELKPKENEK